MTTREATIEDWDKLYIFYKRVYRDNHPLQNKTFWEWQYGNKQYGRALICLNGNNEIVGHVGASFVGNVAWIINVYLDEECRGKGILGTLYDLARKYYPLAATAANKAGLGLYQNMRWIRYYDLVRFVKINPTITEVTLENVCQEKEINVEHLSYKETHYFQQPNLNGIKLHDGSTAISQPNVSGLRVVDIYNSQELEEQAWQLGYNWIDYITSWNDLKTRQLEKNGWVIDNKSIVPWRLNPIVKNYFCDITFLSEKPLPNDFVVHRSFSDHGRIGSLKI
ncbi:MAG: GNAT family N-acetyltransferase [Flavobacterium sp.]|nr:GNAT family N-acetyltransferase [Flavobacterium sp.]